MSYNDDAFWDQYEVYVEESAPRHRKAVDLLLIDQLFPGCLLDLGCGRCQEARELLYPQKYLGVDLVDGPLKLDYRNLGAFCDALQGEKPTAFASLFSVEVTGNWFDNYPIYRRLFEAFPTIEWGLVSGFYYKGEQDQPTVAEAGGIKSYQSLFDLADVRDDGPFEEMRLLLKAPSKMFGPDVIEVWKLLTRKTK